MAGARHRRSGVDATPLAPAGTARARAVGWHLAKRLGYPITRSGIGESWRAEIAFA
jgi:hypothetical protein